MTAAPSAAPLIDESQWNALTFAERFVVWNIRLWLAGWLGDSTAAERSARAFETVGASGAIVPLDCLMRSVSTLASRPVQLACVCKAGLSRDEGLLLDALAVAQADGPVDGLFTLRPLSGPEGCRVLRRLCADCARALAEAGLHLTVRLSGFYAPVPEPASVSKMAVR
ncbi:MAG TPA: hypothetical protein VD978_32125 [Azospirillum sp.]|nr:hypothetical protein [Azospirillum sp.]